MTKQIKTVFSKEPTKSTTSGDFTAAINKDLTTNTVAPAAILQSDPAKDGVSFKKRDFAGRRNRRAGT